MRDKIAKVIDFLYHGGMLKEGRDKVEKEIEQANRNSVIAYSAISLIGFSIMLLFFTFGDNGYERNMPFYMAGIVLMALMLILNVFAAKKYSKIISVSAYAFIVIILAIGIMLSVSSAYEISASYMVFLFVAPLLFILKPLYVIAIIVAANIAYICIMSQIQEPVKLHTDVVNALIYGVLSMFVSTTMIRMRIQKFETDYKNRMLMETDQLTGMLNRYSYMQSIERIQRSGSVDGIKICAFDVNGLKTVNDTLGHHAGDELLCGAAKSIVSVFSNYGNCYRIGGDEFVAILPSGSPAEDELTELLNKKASSFKGDYVNGISISVGITVGTKDDNIEDLLREADAKMYANKAEYYRKNGIDRRGR